MGAPERREREKSEFRDLVLRAARKIVVKEGFDALSMRKIAEAIEYAPGTIYLYFKSRDAIAQELCQRGFAELLEAFAPAAAIRDPVERLREIGRRYIRFGMERQETYRLIFMENPKFSDVVFDEEDENSPGHRALQFLIDAFDELRAKKRLRVDFDSKTLAEATWAWVHGIVSLKLLMTGYPEASAEELSNVMADAVFNGYLK